MRAPQVVVTPPLAAIETDVARARCVTADSPAVLALTSTLHRSLSAGCELRVDPPGEALGSLRLTSATYQRSMADSYTSGDAAVFIRFAMDALTPRTMAAIGAALPVERRHGSVMIRLAGDAATHSRRSRRCRRHVSEPWPTPVAPRRHNRRVRALVLEHPGPTDSQPLQLRDVPSPTPGVGELRLRVAACAVCRTDLQIVTGDLRPHRSPLVPGHQVVGFVTDVGAEVHGWQVGDRAGVTWLAGFDGTCDFCRSGRENLCTAAAFTGWDRDGGFAQEMTVRTDVAVRVPTDFSDEAAAPLLCGGVIGFRALRLSGIQPGGRLGLYGFGASALQAIQVARSWGCEIHVASRSRSDLARAEGSGATSVGDYDERPPYPLDAVITFAPVGRVVVAALRALERGGTVVVNAIHLDGIPAFEYDDLWWERTIRSVANVTRQDAQDYLDLAARIPIRTEIELHPLSDGNAVLARLQRGDVSGAAVLIP